MAVYAKQYGRLGNNLFQRAAAIGYARKHRLEYNLCAWFAGGWADFKTSKERMLIRENGHQFNKLPVPIKKMIVLDGYWQSEKYFSHCREEVLKALGYKWEHIPNVCSIHLRRGDYLLYPDKHPVINADYLDQAIKYMAQEVGINTFIVFSDDIPYTKMLIESHHYDYFFEYSQGRTEVDDLEFMSCCAHNVISNSTFSWWGAWLNQNPNKVVVSPSKDNWFGLGNKHLDTSDLIPDSWIQIKY